MLFTTAAFAEDAYKITTLQVGSSQNYSRDTDWKPGEGLPLEISGMALMPNGDPVICLRKGDVYIIENAYGDEPSYRLYASGLHEPLGMLQKDGDLYVTQRTEVTRIRDRNGDGKADAYDRHGGGWGVSGNYHEYAYGPVIDGEGRMWVTLNIGIGKDASPWADWRGWGGIIEDGRFKPMCAGMRSPAGLGANLKGDVFCVDHQGNWFGTCPLYQLQPGAFYGHQDSLVGVKRPGAPYMAVTDKRVNGIPFPEAVKQMPGLTPPAVWFPYEKTARGLTDVVLDDTFGHFGPFHGQLFVGEFTQAGICRVYLEKVNGAYQGACFRFMEKFPSAVLRMVFGKDGSMFVGMSNRGWSSLGTASYGLQRIDYTGVAPFEIKEMRAKPDGFELVFTRSVDPISAMKPESYRMSSYTYTYHKNYGSDEIHKNPLTVNPVSVSEDGHSVRLKVDRLRALYVHELHAGGLRDVTGAGLVHPRAFYTLNAIPRP